MQCMDITGWLVHFFAHAMFDITERFFLVWRFGLIKEEVKKKLVRFVPTPGTKDTAFIVPMIHLHIKLGFD